MVGGRNQWEPVSELVYYSFFVEEGRKLKFEGAMTELLGIFVKSSFLTYMMA